MCRCGAMSLIIDAALPATEGPPGATADALGVKRSLCSAAEVFRSAMASSPLEPAPHCGDDYNSGPLLDAESAPVIRHIPSALLANTTSPLDY